MKGSLLFLLIAVGLIVADDSAVSAQDDKTDLYSLVLAQADLETASKLMTMYDPNEDGFIDKFEQERLPWKQEVGDYDMNKDGKLAHLEVSVRLAKLRDDEGVTQFDINNVNKFLMRHDKNRNKQLEPNEIREGGWPSDPNEYDRNGDGILTSKELAIQFAFNRELRREMGIEAVDTAGANSMISRFDKDRNRKLDSTEREMKWFPKPPADFDEDGDGSLDVTELSTMLVRHRQAMGLSKPDTFKIRKLFDQFDPGGSGFISVAPLESLKRGNGKSIGEELAKQYDDNKDGIVSRGEVEKVVAAIRKKRGYAETEFQKAKKMITRHDKNSSKHLEEAELPDNPKPGFLSKSMFKVADANRDGKVGLDELARYFAKHPE